MSYLTQGSTILESRKLDSDERNQKILDLLYEADQVIKALSEAPKNETKVIYQDSPETTKLISKLKAENDQLKSKNTYWNHEIDKCISRGDDLIHQNLAMKKELGKEREIDLSKIDSQLLQICLNPPKEFLKSMDESFRNNMIDQYPFHKGSGGLDQVRAMLHLGFSEYALFCFLTLAEEEHKARQFRVTFKK